MNEVKNAIDALSGTWRTEDGKITFNITDTRVLNITGLQETGITESAFSLSYDLENDNLELYSVPIFNAWPGILLLHHDNNSFQVIPMGETTTGYEAPGAIPVTTRYFRIGD